MIKKLGISLLIAYSLEIFNYIYNPYLARAGTFVLPDGSRCEGTITDGGLNGEGKYEHQV